MQPTIINKLNYTECIKNYYLRRYIYVIKSYRLIIYGRYWFLRNTIGAELACFQQKEKYSSSQSGLLIYYHNYSQLSKLFYPTSSFSQLQILEIFSIFNFILALIRASAWAGVSSSVDLATVPESYNIRQRACGDWQIYK